MIAFRPKLIDPLLILILALLPLLFFWRLITPNPADQMNIAAGDFTGQYFPLRAFSAQEWVRGQIPLWNPYLYGGQPALADIQSGALYPPHLLQALALGWGGPLLGHETGFPLKALEWQVIVHFSLAAVGTFLLAKHLLLTGGFRLRPARLGAVVAALVFTFGGYLTGFPVQQLTILEASAWLPWVLWDLSVAIRQLGHPIAGRPSWQRLARPLAAIVLAALALALAVLAGHPQTVMYIFYLSLAYTALLAFYLWRRQISFLVYAFLAWFTVMLLGAALAAAQLAPTLEFISYSVRAELSYPVVSAGLPLTELVSVVYPGFLGGSPEYVGIAALVLIALALRLGWVQFRQKSGASFASAQIFFWAGVALVSLLLAFGNNLFWYPLFYLLAPGFGAVRQQERIFFIYSLAAALLAGFGAAQLVGTLPRPARQAFNRFERGVRRVTLAAALVTGLFIYGSAAATARGDKVNLFYGVLWHHLFGLLILGGLLALLALRANRRLRRGWGMALLAGWVAYNLFTVNWQFNLAQPQAAPEFTPTALVQFLQTHVGQNSGQIGRIASGGLLPGGNSAASVFNLEDITGNTPLHLQRVNNFFEQMPAWRLWQLMNVRYVVDRRDIGDPGLRPVFEADGLKVFEMADPFPRAWLATAVEVIPADAAALARLAAADFNLRTVAVAAKAPAVQPEAAAAGGTVAVKKISPTHLQVTVDTLGNGLLVASQIYYPGWQVFVDGQPAELLRVNVVQQGVAVLAGHHSVDFMFWPGTFSAGLGVSVVALVLCAGLLSLSFWLR